MAATMTAAPIPSSHRTIVLIGIPAENARVSVITIRTNAVPRSGCSKTNPHAAPATITTGKIV